MADIVKKKNMKPLIVLLVVFAGAAFAIYLITGNYLLPLAGCIAMAAMLLFTAIGHFAFTRGMAMMIPPFVPYKTLLVYLTGVLEILFAIGLLIPAIKVTTGWALIVFLILILPANISAAVNKVDYQKGTNDGSGLKYLWFRAPLQALFIGWVYFSVML